MTIVRRPSPFGELKSPGSAIHGQFGATPSDASGATGTAGA